MAGHQGHSLNRAAGTVWHGAGAISVLTVMTWVPGSCLFLWDEFSPDPASLCHLQVLGS